MLKISALDTREVAERIGRSVRRTQELITEGRIAPSVRVIENGRVRLGVRPEVVRAYAASRQR